MNGNKYCRHCDAYKVGATVMHQENCSTWNLPLEWGSEETAQAETEPDERIPAQVTDERRAAA